jgi:hypothetical protein
MKLSTEPFEHILIEDFLLPEHLIKLSEIAKWAQENQNKFDDKKFRLTTVFSSEGKEITDWSLENKTDGRSDGEPLKNYFDISDLDLYNTYYQEVLGIMTYLDPKKYHKVDRIHFDIQTIRPNYNYHVHHDNLKKLISIVIYLYPDNNIGTLLHKTETSEGIENPWRINCGTAFVPMLKKSWHSFGSNNNQRSTFNINIYSDQISNIGER